MIVYQNPFALRASQAGIQYVGGTVAGLANSIANFQSSLNGTLTGGLAASPAQNDEVIVIGACRSGNTVEAIKCDGNVNGAYTQLITPVYANGTYDTRLMAWGYRQGATPDSTLTLDTGTNVTTSGMAALILVFRAVSATTRLDVAGATASGIGSNDPNPPARTPVTDRALVVAFGCASCAPSYATEFTRNSGWSPSVYHRVVGSDSGIKVAAEGRVWRTGDGEIDPTAWNDPDSPATDYTWIAGAIVLRPAT